MDLKCSATKRKKKMKIDEEKKAKNKMEEKNPNISTEKHVIIVYFHYVKITNSFQVNLMYVVSSDGLGT